MKKRTIFLFSIVFTLLSCARMPNPVSESRPGDKALTCSQIRHEIVNNQTNIIHLVPKQSKTGRNILLGVSGAVFVIPWFFMDFSEAERIEIQSYQYRNEWLRILAQDKRCRTMPYPIKFAETV